MLLLPFGLVGVGIAVSVTYLVVGFVSVELARPVVDVSFRETAHAWRRRRCRRWSPSLWCCRWSVSSSGRTSTLCRGLASVVAECLLFMTGLPRRAAADLADPVPTVRDVVGACPGEVKADAARRMRGVP